MKQQQILNSQLTFFGSRFAAEIEAENCRRSLHYFVRKAWATIDPQPYVDNWHIGAICEHLQACTTGQIQRLIINVPPGTAKSTITSCLWPAWEWTRTPGTQSLFGSYDINLALRDSVKCRRVIESDWYQNTFKPRWSFKRDQNAKGYYVNTAGGHRYSFGTLAGGKLGWRGDKVVMDDPNNISHRFNAKIKRDTYDSYNSTLSTRVNDLKKAIFVVIQQRVAHDDLTGYLLEENVSDDEFTNLISSLEWVLLKLPMTATSRRCTTVIGWTDPRKEGEYLFPERFPEKELEHLRTKKLGQNDYVAQYQQEPTPESGSRFTKATFQHWYHVKHGVIKLVRRNGTISYVQTKELFKFVTCDFAASEKTQADFTVFSTWGVTPDGDLLLLDSWWDQVDEPKIIKNAIRIYEDVSFNGAKPIAFVAEDNGLGLPIVQAMRARGLPVLPVHMNSDKFVRTTTAAIRLEAGQIFWPDPATPWYCEPNEGWEVEHIRFPAFKNDDKVDTTSLAAEAMYEVQMFGKVDPVDVEKKDPMSVFKVDPEIAQKFFRGRREER